MRNHSETPFHIDVESIEAEFLRRHFGSWYTVRPTIREMTRAT